MLIHLFQGAWIFPGSFTVIRSVREKEITLGLTLFV